MTPGAIRNANLVMRAPDGMDNCQDLHVRVDEYEGGERCLVSAWYPTAEELQRLNSGEPVWLHIFGNGMPPVALTVP